MYNFICLNCKTPFQDRKKNRKYCCYECSRSFRVTDPTLKAKYSESARLRSTGETNPNYRGGGKAFNCKNCNIEFRVPINVLTGGKHKGYFCSAVCWRINTAKTSVSKKQISINKSFRKAMCTFIRQKNNQERSKWAILTGYTPFELRDHLEKQFTKNMSWANYGKYWHIDHIRPVSFFVYDHEDNSEFKKCWALSNLRPLTAKANLKKSGSNRLINRIKYSQHQLF